MKCEWCHANKATRSKKLAHWELPDGRRAVTIANIPSIHCSHCKMHFIENKIVDEIEDQLVLIDTKNVPSSINYSDLMKIPRRLKKNYFKLD